MREVYCSFTCSGFRAKTKCNEKPDTGACYLCKKSNYKFKKYISKEKSKELKNMFLLKEEDMLLYQNLKDEMEERAEEVLKDYYEYKNWRFPRDFWINGIEVGDRDILINYHAFDSSDSDFFSIKYFLTKDRKYLKHDS